MTSPDVSTEAQTRADGARQEMNSRRRTIVKIVLVAFLLRLAVLTLGRTYHFSPRDDHFGFGWETGRIARSIALGKGFSSPMQADTGPTAWIAPLYPYFLAGLFKLFGVYSNAAAWVALAVNSLFSALTCATLYLLGEELFGTTVALWSAWIWALLPYAIYWPVRFAWETSFATFLLSAVFLIAVRLERDNRLSFWLWFGFFWALIALSNPSLLAFLPFSGIWVLHRQRRVKTMKLHYAVLSGVVFLGCIAPWLLRNDMVFGKFVFIRDNAGAELRLGNGPGADGQWMYWLHPSQDLDELKKYRSLGEVAYVHERKQEAMAWIAENPGRFAAISLKRAFFFWFGTPRAMDSVAGEVARNMYFCLTSILAWLGLAVALRRGVRGGVLFFWMFLSISMIYYFTFTHPRYRHPIEPEMLLVSVYLFTVVEKRKITADNAAECCGTS
ncbi:MAG TPA: glycosyltransferase family 39 protein [Terriglobales bacterium]|nr:glycosyltransferase family 39 protein [Terriglobales bacterium]